MYDGSYWTTEAGLRHKDFSRSISTLRLWLAQEPKSKQAKGKAAARESRDLMLQDATTWHRMNGKYGGRWPRPRAHIALDIYFWTTNPNSPRIDKLCKRLLDELGGATGAPIVYHDDRQVKMLFARCDRSTREPRIAVDAQTATQVRAGLRRAYDLDARWTIEYANDRMSLSVDPNEDIDEDLWWSYAPDVETTRDNALRNRVRRLLSYQAAKLEVTDQYSSSVVLHYADERYRKSVGFRATADDLHDLLRYGLAINLGPLPTRSGQSAEFLARATGMLTALVEREQWMFPLLTPVGVTLYYLETVGGKDLDNIFLTLLPVVLQTVQPPVDALADYSAIADLKAWEEGQAASTEREVAFIEAVALSGITDEQLLPGSVVLALSHGDRRESWWGSVLRFVEEHNSRTSPDFDAIY
ncbi:hypothetical protein [Nocardia gipuzkoensis]